MTNYVILYVHVFNYPVFHNILRHLTWSVSRVSSLWGYGLISSFITFFQLTGRSYSLLPRFIALQSYGSPRLLCKTILKYRMCNKYSVLRGGNNVVY